jgi:HlyD family secretion protein
LSRKSKVTILVLVIAAAVGFGGFAAYQRRTKAVEVRIDTVARRDIVASVTASGVIQPGKLVQLSAEISGKITELHVKEGDRVTRGQILLRIDPSQYQAALQRAEAGLATTKAQAAQSEANAQQARRTLERQEQIRKTNAALVSDEQIEQLRTQVDVMTALEQASKHSVAQAQAGVEDARSVLAKSTLAAPMSGVVTKLFVREGETAVIGSMNRAAGLLMTISDMSNLETLVRVGETDVAGIRIGDSAVIQIDAFRDTTFVGRVVEIANTAAHNTGASTTAPAEVMVEYLVRIQLLNPPAETRMDYSALARIVTARRPAVLSIPIIALTVREFQALASEEMPGTPTVAARVGEVGQADQEGVFVVGEDNKVTFKPVRVGIAGDRYFEVLTGLNGGERIVAGTYQAIRSLKEGTLVRQATPDSLKNTGGRS